MENPTIEGTEATTSEQTAAAPTMAQPKRHWILRGIDKVRDGYYALKSTKTGKVIITLTKAGMTIFVGEKLIDYGRRHPYPQEPEQVVTAEPTNLPEPEAPVEETEQAEKAVEETTVEEQI